MRYQLDQKALADSLVFVAEKQQAALISENRVAKERARRYLFLYIGLGVLMIASGLLARLRSVRRSRAAIAQEKDRSDGLLLNILPFEVAEELKAKGSAEARDFDPATSSSPILKTSRSYPAL